MAQRVIALIVILLGLFSFPAVALEKFDKSELTIETGDGARHAFVVELATSAAQQAQGLMFRPSLAPDHGMLFIYPNDQIITMWMKNTLIPLDMLFLDAAGKIINIAERTIPGSLEHISSWQAARAVLEVNAGTASRLNIRRGDRVLHQALGQDP